LPMTAGALREAINRGKPFRLQSGDGAIVDVPTRDHAFLNPTGRLVIVFTDDDWGPVARCSAYHGAHRRLMSSQHIFELGV
jgi:hypothetical protein